MKYDRYLIVTLPDFRRHFDLKLFYKNKDQFVSDMHPDKVYYWDDNELINSYYTIANWIVEHPNPSCIPTEVALALQRLSGKPISSMMSLPEQFGDMDLSRSIIALSSGQDVNLPPYTVDNANTDFNIRLHKFFISDNGDIPCSISIGDNTHEIEYGDVLYATEINGKFIDFTPNRIENELFSAQLIDSPDAFASILVITDKVNGTKQSIDGVVSFILVGYGYIYINENGKLISIGNETPMLLLRKKELKAIQIKAKQDTIDVLYSNGVSKTTNSMAAIHGVTKI